MDTESISSQNICKELAYLLGVYLTDGSISSFTDKDGYKCYNFSLKAIDKDFVEYTLECIKKIKPDCNASVYVIEPQDRHWTDGRISKCQKQFCLNVGFASWKDFFINQTGNKHHIPVLIWNASFGIKKWFIAGVLDGDGWITAHKRHQKNGNFQYTIGIGGVEEGWIHEFKILLNELGLKTGGIQVDIGKYRKIPFLSFTIKTLDFLREGFFFKIQRKQNRLNLYKEQVQRLNAAHPDKTG